MLAQKSAEKWRADRESPLEQPIDPLLLEPKLERNEGSTLRQISLSARFWAEAQGPGEGASSTTRARRPRRRRSEPLTKLPQVAEIRSRERPESLSLDLDPLVDEPALLTPSDPSTCAEGDRRSEREAPLPPDRAYLPGVPLTVAQLCPVPANRQAGLRRSAKFSSFFLTAGKSLIPCK